MIAKLLQLVRFVLKDHSGQILPWIAVALVAAIGATGLSLDIGHAYIAQRQLQICADAGALAGAQVLPKDPSVQATLYSCSPTGNNRSTALGPVTTHVDGGCLDLLLKKGVPCLLPSNWNAVKVTQTVNVPTMFMRALDFLPGVHLDTITVTAKATAGRTKPIPVNVAVIVDMTGTLNFTEIGDTDCRAPAKKYQCQLYAIQAMLQMLAPCSDGSEGLACTVDKADVRVALFTFPNVSSDPATNTLTNEVCGLGVAAAAPTGTYQTTTITPAPYTFPDPAATTYSTAGLTYTYTPSGVAPLQATYEVVDFSSNYYDSKNTQTGLYANSPLVKAVGQGYTTANGWKSTVPGCLNFPSGIVSSGVSQTYLASSIYAAQSALLGIQAKYANRESRNFIIFISDGIADAASTKDTNNQFATISGGSIRNKPSPSPGQWPVFGTRTISSPGGMNTLRSDGTYPSNANQCQQAITASAFAQKGDKGTTVISIANGAPPLGGTNCSTDSGAFKDSCTVMKSIASNTDTFYSTTPTGCVDDKHSGVTTLSKIFGDVGFGLVRATLIPNSAI